MESYGTIESNNKEEVSTSAPSKSRRLVSVVGIALALVGVTLLVKVNTPLSNTKDISNLKIVKPVTVESSETTSTTTEDVRGSLRGIGMYSSLFIIIIFLTILFSIQQITKKPLILLQ